MSNRPVVAEKICCPHDDNVVDSGLAAFKKMKPIAAIPKVLARTASF